MVFVIKNALPDTSKLHHNNNVNNVLWDVPHVLVKTNAVLAVLVISLLTENVPNNVMKGTMETPLPNNVYLVLMVV